MTCEKCKKCCGWLVLIAGLGFLAADLGYWTFWNLNWWTVVVLILGVAKVTQLSCKDCQALEKKKK